jgi:integrase
MATITKVPSTKEGGKPSYRAQVRFKGRNDSQSFPNRREALAWAAKVETEIREGKHFPNAASRRTTFDKLIEDYTRTKLAEFPEEQRAARTLHLTWWAQQFEGLSLSEVTSGKISVARDALSAEKYTKSPRIPEAVRQQVHALSEAGKSHRAIAIETEQTLMVVRRVIAGDLEPKAYMRSGATVNRYIATLSDMLSFARKERHLLDSNPVSNISRKSESRGRVRFLSDDERDRLLSACAESEWPALQTLVQLAIVTGARRSELINLKWADVDMKAGRAVIHETKNGESRTLTFAGTKALEGLRSLKLKNSARSAYVFPALTVVLDPKTGKPLLDAPYAHFDGVWYAALAKAGIDNFHFHDLRHTCASYLAQRGYSLLQIAAVLGHKTMQVVKRYAHLAVDDNEKAVASMAAAKGL